jgi:hypothetical protein
MIEWLIQVVAVAWLGAVVVMMVKVCEPAALPDGRRRRDPDQAVRLTDSRRSLPPRPHAHRGNTRDLQAAPGHRRRSRAHGKG